MTWTGLPRTRGEFRAPATRRSARTPPQLDGVDSGRPCVSPPTLASLRGAGTLWHRNMVLRLTRRRPAKRDQCGPQCVSNVKGCRPSSKFLVADTTFASDDKHRSDSSAMDGAWRLRAVHAGFRSFPFCDAEAPAVAIRRATRRCAAGRPRRGPRHAPTGPLPSGGVREICPAQTFLISPTVHRARPARAHLRLRPRGCGAHIDLLGKALGGGVVPLSSGRGPLANYLGVLHPGEHGLFRREPPCGRDRPTFGVMLTRGDERPARTLLASVHLRLESFDRPVVVAVPGWIMGRRRHRSPLVPANSSACGAERWRPSSTYTHGSTLFAPPVYCTVDGNHLGRRQIRRLLARCPPRLSSTPLAQGSALRSVPDRRWRDHATLRTRRSAHKAFGLIALDRGCGCSAVLCLTPCSSDPVRSSAAPPSREDRVGPDANSLSSWPTSCSSR